MPFRSVKMKAVLEYRKPTLKKMLFHCLCMCQVQYILAFQWYKNKSFKSKGLQWLTRWSNPLVISIVLLTVGREISFLNSSLNQMGLGVSQKKVREEWVWGNHVLYTGKALLFSKKKSWKYTAKNSSHRKVLSRDEIHSHI